MLEVTNETVSTIPTKVCQMMRSKQNFSTTVFILGLVGNTNTLQFWNMGNCTLVVCTCQHTKHGNLACTALRREPTGVTSIPATCCKKCKHSPTFFGLGCVAGFSPKKPSSLNIRAMSFVLVPQLLATFLWQRLCMFILHTANKTQQVHLIIITITNIHKQQPPLKNKQSKEIIISKQQQNNKKKQTRTANVQTIHIRKT